MGSHIDRSICIEFCGLRRVTVAREELIWSKSSVDLGRSEIFKALDKTRLINGNKKNLQYSRCGRTDKGVSSVGQVYILPEAYLLPEAVDALPVTAKQSLGRMSFLPNPITKPLSLDLT
ncbi:hypothetical protein RHMOL_Rhmol06G0130600 [Rhododendron molle]|uniref:Uncharacterized protein n=1 Tax=Rhododendron molle TaxID=49168 RepID=A0ACC0NBR7_RHOML|nr:hypothetical protein RHMOL_Rhmol06G0130600 [Rhododendron molle]